MSKSDNSSDKEEEIDLNKGGKYLIRKMRIGNKEIQYKPQDNNNENYIEDGIIERFYKRENNKKDNDDKDDNDNQNSARQNNKNNLNNNNDNNTEQNNDLLNSQLNIQKQLDEVNAKLDNYNNLFINLYSTVQNNSNLNNNNNDNKENKENKENNNDNNKDNNDNEKNENKINKDNTEKDDNNINDMENLNKAMNENDNIYIINDNGLHIEESEDKEQNPDSIITFKNKKKVLFYRQFKYLLPVYNQVNQFTGLYKDLNYKFPRRQNLKLEQIKRKTMPYVDLTELKKEINDLKIQQKIDKKESEEKIILGMDKLKRSFENGLKEKEKEQNSHFNMEDTNYNNFQNNTIDYQLNNRISFINSNDFQTMNDSRKYDNGNFDEEYLLYKDFTNKMNPQDNKISKDFLPRINQSNKSINYHPKYNIKNSSINNTKPLLKHSKSIKNFEAINPLSNKYYSKQKSNIPNFRYSNSINFMNPLMDSFNPYPKGLKKNYSLNHMSNKNNSNILFPNKNNHAKKFMRFSLKF